MSDRHDPGGSADTGGRQATDAPSPWFSEAAARTEGLTLPPPVPAEGVCRICGRGPAGDLVFRSNVGLLLTRRAYTARGPFCRDCATGAFRASQHRNVTLGWWGLISFFVTWSYLFSNLSEARKARALPEPRPPAEPEVTSRLRGKPLLARPTAIPAFLVAMAAVVGLVLWQTGAFNPGGSLNRTISKESFDDAAACPYKSLSDSSGTSTCLGGAYVVTENDAESSFTFVRVNEHASYVSISVQADVNETPESGSAGLYGVACVASEDEAYLFVVDERDKVVEVVKANGTEGHVLRRLDPAPQVPTMGQQVTVAATCAAGSGTSTALTMSLDGTEVLSTIDATGAYRAFQGFGLTVISTQGGTAAAFDNLEVTRG